MNNKKIIAGVVGILVIVGIIWAINSKTSTVNNGNVGGLGASTTVKGADAFRPDNAQALETVQGGTRETVSKDIKTPGLGETGVSADVAVPIAMSPIGKFTYRKFEIKGEGGKFVPSTMVIDAGDVVEVKFTAVDADYNFSISDFGVTQTVKKGDTKAINFQGYDFGQYKIFCDAKVCANTTEGLLIANKRL